jgi:hypothetical protein
MSTFLNSLSSTPILNISTISSNGDLNPYGVTIVPNGFPTNGSIKSNDILVSNFNNSSNLQGTGSTIVAIDPKTGGASTFFTAPSDISPVGLSTALVALKDGIVIVGNTPTTDGTSATISAGSLIFIDRSGKVILNYKSNAINGPWDMVIDDKLHGNYVLYITNVLNGTITKMEIYVEDKKHSVELEIKSIQIIAAGFGFGPNGPALVVGPTGLVLHNDNLYVAETFSNSIHVLRNVSKHTNAFFGPGDVVYTGNPLQGPLGLAFSSEKTLIASNGDAINDVATNNQVVEIDIHNKKLLDVLPLGSTLSPPSTGAGGLFGITIGVVNGKESLIYVDDANNALVVLQTK